MTRIKVNWKELTDLGKRTLENRDTFEASRSRLQELVNELMNYWKGEDAENYHERATDFFEYLKGDTQHMDEWGKYFGKASSNYKSGVEEGLKSIKKTNALIEDVAGNPDAITADPDIVEINSFTDYSGTFSMADSSNEVGLSRASGGNAVSSGKGEPDMGIPELNNPQPDIRVPEPDMGIPELNNPQPDIRVPDNMIPIGEVKVSGDLIGKAASGGTAISSGTKVEEFTSRGGSN